MVMKFPDGHYRVAKEGLIRNHTHISHASDVGFRYLPAAPPYLILNINITYVGTEQ